jgi:hypothetical protein
MGICAEFLAAQALRDGQTPTRGANKSSTYDVLLIPWRRFI